jgi:hypothetical protein
MKKKQVLIVKSLEELSPKKQLYVSRQPFFSEGVESLQETSFGNDSPKVSSLLSRR